MKPKYKVTGCARFFIFLIIFVPIVYFGAAFIRGENGVDKIKEFWGNITGSASSSDSGKDKALTIEELREKLREAERTIERLEDAVESRDEEIKRLKEGTQK